MVFEVIYENGVLRPLHPLDLAEGTVLEVTTVEISTTEHTQLKVDEAEYRSFLGELTSIATLPLESPPQPFIAENHDSILYPKQGRMP